MSFKTPLTVYVVWHPSYTEGQQIADSLYSILCRDINKPLIRSLGIPVYYRYKKTLEGECPLKIDFSESEYTAVIALISDEFVIDSHYSQYLDSIFDECSSKQDKRRVYPIALSRSAYNISSKLSAINFSRINEKEKGFFKQRVQKITNQIKGPILHELCRLLMHMKRASDESESLTNSPPVRLFISHSKHDESRIDAQKFRNYIYSETQLKSFFDTNDISFGSNFGEEIKRAASESVLIVFQSDSYSDREWCRIEVLEAKSAGCPIVIVNDIRKGEKRAFPYLGNYPSIRLNKNYSEIINLALEQVLFNLFQKRNLDALTTLYGIKTNRILSTSPELFNLIQLRKDGLHKDEKYALVIYPDPPLGSEEMDILNQLDDNFTFITPITLPSLLK